MTSDLLPFESNGRWIGRALEWFGVKVELSGLWLQEVAAELRWRRVSAWRRWGT